MDKVLNGIKCQGHEQHLYECYHEQVNEEVECDERSMVAGVICTNREYCLSVYLLAPVCVFACLTLSDFLSLFLFVCLQTSNWQFTH